MNITKYILDISLICILKFSFKNLLRCSENKQRKEKTQTMKKNFILLFINIILNLSKNLNKKFFKNLFRCSENKQRKEKTQTMKKNFILLFIRFNYFGGLTSSSCLKVTVVLSLLVVLFN